MCVFWVFKLSFAVDILTFLTLQLFGLFFEKFGDFFSNYLVTLESSQLLKDL
jgi:hypothetical protein